MRETYIKKVKENLVVSKKQKNEVVRDLQEAFASALEHGETEQQVIERLGTPADFANNIHEQFGINCKEKQNRKKKCQIAIALIIAITAFAIGGFIKVTRVPNNAIGQADAMTNIQISGTAIDPIILFLLMGIAALILAVVLIVRYIQKNNSGEEK